MTCQRKLHRAVTDFVPTLDDLQDTGRLQFFYHSPCSILPVRDVLGEQGHGYKTEPYIERNAENFCSWCRQCEDIQPFLKSRAKYVFLFTTCRNRRLTKYRAVCVVGYIRKDRCQLRLHGGYAVIGETKLYSFEDALVLCRDGNPRHIKRMVGRDKTCRLLDHFDGRKNIL